MTDKKFPKSNIPIRKSSDFLPQVFKTETNDKFLQGTLDGLIQPGVLDKLVGYIGRRYGKTYRGDDVYLDSDQTLRSRYQLEPAVVLQKDTKTEDYFDYLDLKNILSFFNNVEDNDNITTEQEHYSWDPPIDWDKFINYREYYWVPDGPPPVIISGQSQSIESTYRVRLGTNANSYIFYPDGLTNNPTITLYRGQTYNFIVNTPGEGLTIKRNYDTGSLRYNPDLAYPKGALVLFDSKLWRSLRDIAQGDGSTIDEFSQDWEYVEPANEASSLDYNFGTTNNGAETGTITFTVPFDAPDILYYQSSTNPDRLGRFLIANVDTNTFLDVEKEIIGKLNYKSGNGIELTNGLVIKFSGSIAPEKYADTEDRWIVEGVGSYIRLVKFSNLLIPADLNETAPEVLFDDGGFDTDPFDDAQFYPSRKDYITVNRSSLDLNAWSRYNRWFHRDVLNYAHAVNLSDFDSDETRRAKRPIIEFKPNIQLFNHGSFSKDPVDFIDDFTDDVFSKIEGSTGYLVDGEALFEGARILCIADTDKLANNKIYRVTFIIHNGRKQISLKETDDSVSTEGDCVLVKRGQKNIRSMYHYNGEQWVKSQEKSDVNQAPMFDVFDSTGISLSDNTLYPVSSFQGSKIFSYKVGNSITDSELGFSLSYLNIENAGDISFNFDWEIDQVYYQQGENTLSKFVKTGFYKFVDDSSYGNCWTNTEFKFIQPIIDSKIITVSTNQVVFSSIDWEEFDLETESFLEVFINGERSTNPYSRTLGTFTFENLLSVNDVVSLKIFCNTIPNEGYYGIPIGLEKNPLNQNLTQLTYGTIADHLKSALEFNTDIVGPVLGENNLRDLNGFQPYGTRIVKHSGLAPVALALAVSKDFNIIKSLEYNAQQYLEFKNTFIRAITDAVENLPPKDLVDLVLTQYSKSKLPTDAFSNSDMVGSGGFSEIVYEVEDPEIKTFTLSEKFDLQTLSYKAVYVYLNESQLIHGRDYTFDSTFGFLNLSTTLAEGDNIVIREYISTANNFIPSTPTKMGLYKKYLPYKFIDNTYQVPREVIQGHDGSITAAYGDYRDDCILELELRIYNNIKKEYDPLVFDIDLMRQGYYQNGVFSKSKIDRVLTRYFYKWLSNTSIDFTNNDYFDSENSFTYTYSTLLDRDRTVNLPGYWRGVYQWFYDTDRPHTRPWEMLGFSEQPNWWESEYGPAPYTKNNLLLWEDLRDGIIRQGVRAGTYDRYKRPTLLDHLPVDKEGNLLSPLDSNLAVNFSLINCREDFKAGDISPVEYTWRSSSDFPFAILIAMAVYRPFDFIVKNFNNNDTELNVLGQIVDKESEYFSTIEDYSIPSTNNPTSGLVVYLSDYLKGRGLSPSTISDFLQSIDVRLSSRLSGFVDQDNQRYLLDSKNPNSLSSTLFIPQENYDIIFNVSAPVSSVTYSGIVIEKVNRGWQIRGYDKLDPVFKYYSPVKSSSDPTITVGGVSENFLKWAPEKFYGNGVVISYGSSYYRAIKSFTSGLDFSAENLKPLSSLPIVGGITVSRRIKFNDRNIREMVYGTILTSAQDVVDFIFGYDLYLRKLGFLFEDYDLDTGTPKNWLTSIKEFLFWTQHNWQEGSLLTLSPLASSIKYTNTTGVVDNLLDSFYDYSVLKADGTPLLQNLINVYRGFQEFRLSTTNTNEGIYFFKGFLVLKEHVVVFDDRTVFNDVVYDKPTGYRQERIKSRGFRTTDWDGDYTSPGFIFDNVKIDSWQTYTDYKLGDIILYQDRYYTSRINQSGTSEFDYDNWTRLDLIPKKQLIPNFDYRINQIDDYYDLDSEGVGQSQRDLARHLVGYQPRTYLENIAEDPVLQYKLYQGFIREKGTANSITKIFDKTSDIEDDSVVLKEEWAFRVGTLGGNDQLSQIEFLVDKNSLMVNPQITLLENATSGIIVDQYLRIPEKDFTIGKVPFTFDVNSKIYFNEINRSAGFVKKDHVDGILKNSDALLNVNIFSLTENDHIWLTFENNSWTVLRFNQNQLLVIDSVEESGQDVTLTFNVPHSYVEGDLIGIKYIGNLEGFYKITSIGTKSVTITKTTTSPVSFDPSTITFVYDFTVARFNNYESLDQEEIALLKSGSKVWVDNNGDKKYEVIQKNNVYSSKSIVDYGISVPLGAGTRVVYADLLSQTITSYPSSGYVIAYSESIDRLVSRYLITAPEELTTLLGNSFGKGIALSPDNRFLIVGAPNASGIRSSFLGEYDSMASYFASEVVEYGGKLWKAKEDIVGDGSSIDVYSDRWEPATLIEYLSIGRGLGYANQGAIFIYEWQDQQWNYRTTLLSPSIDENENFGFDISIGITGSNYFAAVSAPGAFLNRGRVYLFTYNGTTWSHLVNSDYVGQYSSGAYYPEGAIVYYDKKLWQAQTEIIGDESTIAIDGISTDWVQIDPVSTEASLPMNVFLGEDDGSTIASGILTEQSISELIKQGDKFGHRLNMNRDGSILVISTPYSDGQFFNNYRGDWNLTEEYVENDVVRYQNNYYRLSNPELDIADSSIVYTNIGDDPSDSEAWINVGDSTNVSKGKVFIYQRDQYNRYVLKQTITAGNLSSLNDTGIEESIEMGDLFGYDLDIDYTGTTLVISSPESDINFINQGAVFVFETSGFSDIEYRLKQKLISHEKTSNSFFGASVSISANTEQIVVGAKSASSKLYTTFDSVETKFDQSTTIFSESNGYPGQVYVFQKKSTKYLLAEKLEADLQTFESFGESLDTTASTIVVGSPGYGNAKQGMVRIFKKNSSENSWSTISIQEPVVDVELIHSISLYDTLSNKKVADLDYIDPYKNKILGIAEQEIDYKTLYDPAIYSIGNDLVSVDTSQPWREKQVGKVWWNLDTVKWINYEQGDITYRSGNWGEFAVGSTVDVCEWVESVLLPSEWSAIADTTDGLSVGISGQPVYPDDSVYSVKQIYNINTGELSETKYYYWVKNKKTIAGNRRKSVYDIAAIIQNPAAANLPFMAFTDSDSFLFYNFDSVITNSETYLNIEYKKTRGELTPIHREYVLLTEGQADSLPPASLERKWLDSLVGFDEKGNPVPDQNLPIKQKYGVLFRPRQSMFVDREKILKIVIDNINSILETRPFADTANFDNFNSEDEVPSEELNEYDIAVDNFIDLEQVGTARLRRAILTPVIIDGEIESINIIDTGFGYRVAPTIEIEGTGTGAKGILTIDSQGRVSSATITVKGKNYSSALIKIREFSVLVEVDETSNGYWSIYSYDQQRLGFYRSKTQAYSVKNYWEYIDWWKAGYTAESKIKIEIDNLYLEPTLVLDIDDLVRVKEYGTGGWIVIERTQDGLGDFGSNYNLVGRQNGTIRIKESLYNTKTESLGFDNVGAFDATLYDLQPSLELRIILKAIKEDIFKDDLRVEWNNLFFKCINYLYSEQEYVDWAFKTSFLNAIHNVGPLKQKLSFKNDFLDSYRDYLEEVKPYRTTIREFTSRYTNIDNTNSLLTDFDLPPDYSKIDGRIVPVSSSYDRLSEFPWKLWTDNNYYIITAIEISNPGADYTSPPTVRIEGDGQAAAATAYIVNGKVSAIRVTNSGYGYTKAPTITLVGGNGNSTNIAKAVAIIGDSKVRMFDLKIKFDRINKTGSFENYNFDQTFIANGSSASFNLTYAPTRDKSKITVIKNNQLVLSSQYSITLYTSANDSYTVIRGKLIFNDPPLAGDVIQIIYDKNEDLYDSVDRINKYYQPFSGMKGKEINQLMTGVDYGGVLIQGTTFDVTGGWDALPWFTEGWDSVESNGDFYYVMDIDQAPDSEVDGQIEPYRSGAVVEVSGRLYVAIADTVETTTGTIILPLDDGWEQYWEEFSITLPYTPAAGQQVTIYLKRNFDDPYIGLSLEDTLSKKVDNLQYSSEISQNTRTIRIDDPFFSIYDGSTIQPNGRINAPETALMPTFVGDGSTNIIEFVDQETGLPYLRLLPGDTLIFRTIDSDGSLIINDVNLIDTNISGGNLSSLGSAYLTATGTLAEEIIIDGSDLVNPTQVPAPEENIPGQVLESVSIRVYNVTKTGASPLQTKIYLGDNNTKTFSTDLEIFESSSVIVYVDKIKQVSGIDYVLDIVNNSVVFETAPAETSVIEIISVGIGGLELLDYQEFVADGETNFFLTKARYDQTSAISVTVNGELTDIGYVNSSDFIDDQGLVLVQFGIPPERNTVIKVISIGVADDVDSSGLSLIRVNKQQYYYDGSSRKFAIDGFVNLQRGSSNSSALVTVNGRALIGIDTVYEIYDGVNNSFSVGVDPEEAIGNITSGNIKVYVNKELKRFVIDYVYDGNQNLITISNLNLGDEIKIEIDLRAEFYFEDNDLVISTLVPLFEDDVIELTWFGEYPSLDIISDEYSGGKLIYKLSRIPLDISYLWVYKNGIRLSQDVDYIFSKFQNSIILKDRTVSNDQIKIIQFGSQIKQEPVAYEIFKDMLNKYHFKRYSRNANLLLAKDLNYYDLEIEVTDGTELFNPIPSRNIPGAIIIGNERIEYFEKSGNILRKLRRGCQGTAISELYTSGEYVIDISPTETIPYNEEQIRSDFVSDGSSLLIGPLEFVPSKSNGTFYRLQDVDGTYLSIPAEYGQCDDIEVFVGGKRLLKTSIDIYDENLGVISPEADKRIEAEFSVDGANPYLRLTTPAPVGTRITVIRKIGRTWQERGENSASKGVTFTRNDTPIIKFINEKTSQLPE